MYNDNNGNFGYAQLMAEQRPFITVSLCLKDPIELDDFVGFFGAVSGEFDRYMRANFPDVASQARFYVQEVRKGSIIADIFPGGISDIIQLMDGILIVTGFSALVGRVVLGYSRGEWKDDASRAELNDLYDAVNALAKDPDGKATIETVTWEKGIITRKVALTFTSNEAREAAMHIDAHKVALEKKDRADHERVLMYFKRPDIGNAKVGKPSGERVVIEEISDRDLALSYASSLSEEKIKDIIRNTPGNVFYLGFVVDVKVQTKGGKPVAYSVTHVHQVVDLPQD